MPDTGVQFEEETRFVPTRAAPEGVSISRFLVSRGLAKDERTADIILVALIVLTIVATAIVYVIWGSAPKSSVSREEADRVMQASLERMRQNPQ
ncbi:MAG TPA: hypothetical protein VIR98_02720 [Candidatus Paceibacterota bacterium]